MSLELVLQNILNPPILFFFLGMLAVFVKSDLDIPQPLPKFFSLFLLISIGLQGGYKIAQSSLSLYVLLVLLSAVFMAVAVPIYGFFILRLKLDVYNAAAIAATYGSISAVTFITGGAFLNSLGESYGGYMVAAMALMESPAIIVGLLLVSLLAKNQNGEERANWKEIFKEAFFNGSVFLLMGSFFVGILVGEKGWKSMEPFFGNLFKPMLAFFLLDMGIVAARQMGTIKKVGRFLVAFGILFPIFNAAVAILLAKLLGFSKGDAFMFSLLCASASYIAVPAAMRLSLPEANPSFYVTMSLALTFPFNITIGIPLYYQLISLIWG
ncbi:sodium-dependent bicarbonate transport family permease [Thermocrinis jamiesonii]|jgi:Predicted permease|uniref:sodium-dependent bicarbonate transport family permease n=1 Tax=Thermocrinis jamiesonii TaxID=1302351 RepID=UPI00049739C3|nr:sodium-dependent bicarbonate transport family permease [Thermocrinis jamiesonii]